jgi:hypothetical protein
MYTAERGINMASAYCDRHRRLTKPLYFRDGKGSFKRAYGLVICCEEDPQQMHIDIERGYHSIPYTKEAWDKLHQKKAVEE